MKIFVTGASGFIGSNLVPLLQQQHEVHAMSSDLTNHQAVEQELLQVNPDIVVHLAARTEVERSFYEQTSFSEVNYVGSVNLIESAKKCSNLKNFVFASTMEVYGWQPISDSVKLGLPFLPVAFDEHTEPYPNAPYAVAKYAVEKYLEYMHRTQGFPFTALRQTNAYGRQDNNFFVTEQIITQMLGNPDQIRLGYREPYRNFIYVSDVLDAWVTAINNYSLCNSGMIFTVGPDCPVKIGDYADIIATKLNWRGKIQWDTKPDRPGEIYWLNSNNNLITSVLGWSPQISLDHGLDLTIQTWKQKC